VDGDTIDSGVDTGSNVGGDTGQQQGTEGNGSVGNPAWNEFLQVVPQELHGQVTPILEKWDKGVQDRFQKVHSEYEPWKGIIDTGASPDEVNWALNLLNAVNTNPELVYRALKENYKFDDQPAEGSNTGQGQNEPNQDDPYAARFAEIERQNQIMAQTLLAQREAEMQAQQDAELDKELTGLRKKYGDFDEDYVLGKMFNGMTGENAVKAFVEMRDRLMAQGPKPLIMGGGGGIPGNNTDVRKLDDSGTKNLVAQMLQAAAQQRNQ
jgi:hypothetical protein